MVGEEKVKLRQSGLMSTLIAQRLNLKAAQASAPSTVDPAAVDPAIQQAMALVQQPAQAAGGGVPMQTGMPTGQSQPEANAGYASASNGVLV